MKADPVAATTDAKRVSMKVASLVRRVKKMARKQPAAITNSEPIQMLLCITGICLLKTSQRWNSTRLRDHRSTGTAASAGVTILAHTWLSMFAEGTSTEAVANRVAFRIAFHVANSS